MSVLLALLDVVRSVRANRAAHLDPSTLSAMAQRILRPGRRKIGRNVVSWWRMAGLPESAPEAAIVDQRIGWIRRRTRGVRPST